MKQVVQSFTATKQAFKLMPNEENFYSQMKELNELQLFSNNIIPCVEELEVTYESGMVGSALGGGFFHTRKLKLMKYEEAISTPNRPYWGYDVETEHKKFVENCVWEAIKKYNAT